MSAWMIALVVFAAVGLAFVMVCIAKGCMTIVSIIRNLAQALNDAVAIGKEFRADFALIRTLAATQRPPDSGYEDEGGAPAPKTPSSPIPFPTPIFERFVTKKEEEAEAPPERPETVDVTATEEEELQEDRLEELRKMGLTTEALEEDLRVGRVVESN